MLRRAAGAATRTLAGLGRGAVSLPTQSAAELEAVARGALLGAYEFTRFRTRSADPKREALRSVVIVAPADSAPGTRAVRAAVARARAIADATVLTRDLVNTPPNVLTPAEFATVAAREAKRAGIGVRVLDEKALRRGGYGGIIGVGQGSANPPRLVRLEYRHPRRPATSRSSARASPSTPAASPSSRPPAWRR